MNPDPRLAAELDAMAAHGRTLLEDLTPYPRAVIAQGKRQGLARRQETIRAAAEAVEVANPGASLAELERQAITGNRAQRRRAEQALARVERKALRR